MCLVDTCSRIIVCWSVLNFTKTFRYTPIHTWRKVSREVEAFSKTSFCHRAAPNSLTAPTESLATNQCRLASVYLRSLSRSTTIADRKFRFHFSPSFFAPSPSSPIARHRNRLTRTGFRHLWEKEREREREKHTFESVTLHFFLSLFPSFSLLYLSWFAESTME